MPCLSDHGPFICRFGDFELDGARFELRSAGERVHVEPQVLSLLLLLAENQERMVGKDEIIDRIWDGRIVSESAVAARIKAARKAIGDDGSAQRLIRTVHGRGFRFVGEAVVEPARHPAAPVRTDPFEAPGPSLSPSACDGRPSIAVLPFELLGEGGPHDVVGDALPAELIMDLARLHWLFVIARGSSFRFRGADADPVTAGGALGVRYCLTGTIERSRHALTVSVTLAETETGGVLWAESYRGELSELQELRSAVVDQVVASLADQITRNEVRLARGRPVSELDAWACFHLGLDHMYRFNQADNRQAAHLFEQALARDPWFARALGGLSFTHFQNAFLRHSDQPEAEAEQARLLAHRALEADRMEPFAHFNLGRSFWLEGKLDDSIDWFDRATALSPSFAQGIYNRGLVGTLAGRAEQADPDLALALELSPLDPLAYAMVSSRALTHVQFGDMDKAAGFGVRAALMPGAHKHIELIAALTSHLAGKREGAAAWLARAQARDPRLDAAAFFRSFPYAGTAARETIERGLRELGL